MPRRQAARRLTRSVLGSATVPSGTRVACLPVRTSLSLRSLRLAHKSTSKLVLLVLVTRVCQAAFRELRSRRGETIDIRGIAAETRAAINIPHRWPLPPGDPQNSAGGLKTRRMRCRSRFGSAFGVILVALALFFRPLRFTRAFRMRSGLHFGTLWTPKSMLPSRREHRFQKISVSAIYLHFGLKIPSQSDLLDAQMALKTRPKRLKSAPRRSWRRFLAVSGGLLERSWVPLGRFGALRALQGVPPRLFGTIF